MFTDYKSAMCLVVLGNKIRNEFRGQPPRVDISHWLEQFKETGSVCNRMSAGRSAVIEAWI
jgi:hypothetical protein